MRRSPNGWKCGGLRRAGERAVECGWGVLPHHWLALIPIMDPMLDGFFQKEDVQIFPPPVGVSQIVPWAGGDHELFCHEELGSVSGGLLWL